MQSEIQAIFLGFKVLQSLQHSTADQQGNVSKKVYEHIHTQIEYLRTSITVLTM
jgi:hypothetical protein